MSFHKENLKLDYMLSYDIQQKNDSKFHYRVALLKIFLNKLSGCY